MKSKSSVRRIAAACEGLVRRCRGIVRAAESGDKALAALFAKREIRATNEICCELLLAVAESSSVDDLAANRANFMRLRTRVMEANDMLVVRTQANPQTMSSIMNAEDTFIDLLVSADPTVRLVAGFARQNLGLVKSVLTSFFTDLGLQLAANCGEGTSWGRRLCSALSAPVGALVRKRGEGLLAQYGDGRCERSGDISFMRSLCDKGNPKLNSWPKVADYVRCCRDESDPNFGRCAEIRIHVQAWAKREKGGVERVWRSLAQQLKLSHGKSRKGDDLGPVAIPDRSWA